MKRAVISIGLACMLAPTSAEPAVGAAEPDLLCMTAKSAPRGPKAPEDFTILVPREEAERMKARGFVTAACGRKADSAEEYRQKICGLAAKAPAPVQAQFAAVYGATPDELCRMAGGAADK